MTTLKDPTDELHFIYLLREREFVRLNEECYKIGRTSQDPAKRFEGYPKGSEIILYIAVDNSITAEKQLLTIFKKEFKQKKDYGSEYFCGENPDDKNVKNDMIKAILGVATKSMAEFGTLNKVASLTSQVEQLQAQLKQEKERSENIKREVLKVFEGGVSASTPIFSKNKEPKKKKQEQEQEIKNKPDSPSKNKEPKKKKQEQEIKNNPEPLHNPQEKYIDLEAEASKSGISQELFEFLRDILPDQVHLKYSQDDIVNEIMRYINGNVKLEFYCFENRKEQIFQPDSKIGVLFRHEKDKLSLKKLRQYLEVHFA